MSHGFPSPTCECVSLKIGGYGLDFALPQARMLSDEAQCGMVLIRVSTAEIPFTDFVRGNTKQHSPSEYDGSFSYEALEKILCHLPKPESLKQTNKKHTKNLKKKRKKQHTNK